MVDAELFTDSPSDVPALAKRAEEFGFDCLWANETRHDPFVQLALAAANTRRMMVGTSIALAFARSPTTIAYAAWDLQSLSAGRLLLGLGSQVKGHIERRFGMKWDSPAPKMREVVQVLRALWSNWQSGSPLDFSGRFYRIDLMTPFFNPGPIANPAIPIYVAGVNTGMCALVGTLGDGLHVHPLHTQRYLKEVVLPALSKGLAKAGRKRKDVSVAASVFAAVGGNAKEIERMKSFYRSQISFYASTRTYRKVMELHGWGDLCDRLHRHSVAGDWKKMEGEIGDDILSEFVIEGTWEEAGEAIEEKYGGLVDRVRVYRPFDGSEGWRSLVAGFDGRQPRG